MTFLTEEQLEDFIYENRSRIHERGLPKFYENTIRQFTLPKYEGVFFFKNEYKQCIHKNACDFCSLLKTRDIFEGYLDNPFEKQVNSQSDEKETI